MAATTIYVNGAATNCSDTGAGTTAAPLCTINAGAARAQAGDTVTVAAGTYPEQVNVTHSGTSSAPIVIAAAPGATVTVSGQANGFRIASKSWVTIRGFHVTNTTSHGINVTGSTAIVIDGNDVSGAGAPVSGQVARGISLTSSSFSSVRNNVTHDNSDSGIYIGAGSQANTVSGNSSSHNARTYIKAAVGIDVRGPNTTVSSNTSFSNEDSGINLWDGANNSSAFNNILFRNGDHGVDVKSSNNTRVESNTIYTNYGTGAEVFTSTGTTLANNIFMDNGVNNAGDSGNLLVDASSTSTTSADYDVVYLSSPGVMFDWNGQQYSTLAAFVAGTGSETHGVQGNPAFRNTSAADFRLSAGSPAIDSANSGVAGHPALDAKGAARIDDPNTANTGAGPRLFDDRGALEFNPSSK